MKGRDEKLGILEIFLELLAQGQQSLFNIPIQKV